MASDLNPTQVNDYVYIKMGTSVQEPDGGDRELTVLTVILHVTFAHMCGVQWQQIISIQRG